MRSAIEIATPRAAVQLERRHLQFERQRGRWAANDLRPRRAIGVSPDAKNVSSRSSNSGINSHERVDLAPSICVGRHAERLLGGTVERDDAAPLVERNDAAGQRVEDRGVERLGSD